MALASVVSVSMLAIAPVTATAATTTPPAPTVTLHDDTVYPEYDGADGSLSYKDELAIAVCCSLKPPATEGWDYDIHLEVADAAGAVRSTWEVRCCDDTIVTYWAGRDQAGALLPEGTYELRVYLVDRVDGSVSEPTTRPIYVVRKHLEERVFDRTLTPSRRLISSSVGRCSRLVRLADPTWPGAYGQLSNRLCRSTLAASRVTTVYGVTLPATHSRWPITVTMFGGARPAKPRSIAGGQVRLAGDVWSSTKRLEPPYTTHMMGALPASWTPSGSRTLQMRVSNHSGSWYEVLRLHVHFSYLVMVPDPA